MILATAANMAGLCQACPLDGALLTGRGSGPAARSRDRNWRFRVQISTFISQQLISAEKLLQSDGAEEWEEVRSLRGHTIQCVYVCVCVCVCIHMLHFMVVFSVSECVICPS